MARENHALRKLRDVPPPLLAVTTVGTIKALVYGRWLCRSRCLPQAVADKTDGARGEQSKSAWFGRDVQHEVLVIAAALHGERCRQTVDRAAEVAPQAAIDSALTSV